MYLVSAKILVMGTSLWLWLIKVVIKVRQNKTNTQKEFKYRNDYFDIILHSLKLTVNTTIKFNKEIHKHCYYTYIYLLTISTTLI